MGSVTTRDQGRQQNGGQWDLGVGKKEEGALLKRGRRKPTCHRRRAAHHACLFSTWYLITILSPVTLGMWHISVYVVVLFIFYMPPRLCFAARMRLVRPTNFTAATQFSEQAGPFGSYIQAHFHPAHAGLRHTIRSPFMTVAPSG